MSDFEQVHRQNPNVIADAPPTHPQGLPETPTLQNVQGAGELLRMSDGDQAIHELYAHFGVKSADFGRDRPA
jgi:hypothetical protein